MRENVTGISKYRKIALRAAIIFGGGLGVLFIVSVAIIAPDQFRSVPDPFLFIGRSNGADAPAKTTNNEGGKSAASEVYPIPLDELLCQDFRPCPDLSIFPEELRGAAMEWNSATENLIAAFRELRLDTEGVTLDDIWARSRREGKYLMGAETSYHRYNSQLKDVEGFHSPDLLKWREIALRMALEEAVEREEWELAIYKCQLISMHRTGSYTERDPYWWDYEVYCYRKAGLAGRFDLAMRTLSLEAHESPERLKFVRFVERSKLGREATSQLIRLRESLE